ncbi:hypothetical protein Sps_04656 [Shewanella psychrophila]|uniref:Uncharacterized protein n=1 Tax=Shewanella psychrophila TaxID=225848 RepID=A0A1S6HW61_9GAMM|nr:hypothetical protein [Shewanella psychrophila]AQS39741.1 hypothetical protein Sps_04656 [Shewanella psychrophila]
MGKTEDKEVRVNNLDQMHLSIISAITIALLFWVGTTLNGNQIELSKLQVKVAELSSELRQATSYDHEVQIRVEELEKYVAVLEGLVKEKR